MSDATFALTVAAAETLLFNGEAWQVSARSAAGGFALRARHEPFLTALAACTLEVAVAPEQRRRFAIAGGMLDFHDNRCTIVVQQPDSSPREA